jgi:L-lactate dehydrogenase complex protein LldG
LREFLSRTDPLGDQKDMNAMENQEPRIQTLKAKAEAAQTQIIEAPGMKEAFRYAVELTQRQGGTTLAAPGLEGKDRQELADLCNEKGIALFTENLREHLKEIHTGLSVAQWGIAETATLVQVSSSEDLRIASMLSETHVALLPRSRIKMDALELKDELSRIMKTPSTYLAFISGASRTADIERVLTIGVHGPQELHVLILDDEVPA